MKKSAFLDLVPVGWSHLIEQIASVVMSGNIQ